MPHPPTLPFLVYGTLRPGGGNDRLWHGHAEVIRYATEIPGYRLVHNGGFPYAIPDVDSTSIGSIIQPTPSRYASILSRLDALEGYPHHYDRVPATTSCGVECWIYVPTGWRRVAATHPEVPGNDWMTFTEERRFDRALRGGYHREEVEA